MNHARSTNAPATRSAPASIGPSDLAANPREDDAGEDGGPVPELQDVPGFFGFRLEEAREAATKAGWPLFCPDRRCAAGRAADPACRGPHRKLGRDLPRTHPACYALVFRYIADPDDLTANDEARAVLMLDEQGERAGSEAAFVPVGLTLLIARETARERLAAEAGP